MPRINPMANEDPLFKLWLKHSTNNSMAQSERNRMDQINTVRGKQKMTDFEVFNMIKERGICPKCESATYRTKGFKENGMSQCPKCGHRGPTVTIDEYITEKGYRS